MDQIKEKLAQTKLLGIIGAALTLIGIFLPFATVSASLFGYKTSVSVNYIEGDGKLILALTILSLVLMFSNLIATKVAFFEKLKNPKYVLVPTALSVIILIISMVNVGDTMGSVGGLVKVSYGIGVWVIWLGLIATAAYPFLYKKAE